jgi:hypothetical protein
MTQLSLAVLAVLKLTEISPTDLEIVGEQLGRFPRGCRRVAARCECTGPLVIQTSPRLPDGTPFPTTYYLTCPRLAGAIGTLESTGLMREMEAELALDQELADKYQAAHERYLLDREKLGAVPELEGISAGGMPNRVKCLHVLIAQSLACGPGVNPLGDRALAMLSPWWNPTSCLS